MRKTHEQFDSKDNVFGLLPKYLVYLAGGLGGVRSTAETAHDAAAESFEAAKLNITSVTTQYNKQFPESEDTLTFNPVNPQETINAIDDLLTKPRLVDGKWISMLEADQFRLNNHLRKSMRVMVNGEEKRVHGQVGYLLLLRRMLTEEKIQPLADSGEVRFIESWNGTLTEINGTDNEVRRVIDQYNTRESDPLLHIKAENFVLIPSQLEIKIENGDDAKENVLKLIKMRDMMGRVLTTLGKVSSLDGNPLVEKLKAAHSELLLILETNGYYPPAHISALAIETYSEGTRFDGYFTEVDDTKVTLTNTKIQGLIDLWETLNLKPGQKITVTLPRSYTVATYMETMRQIEKQMISRINDPITLRRTKSGMKSILGDFKDSRYDAIKKAPLETDFKAPWTACLGTLDGKTKKALEPLFDVITKVNLSDNKKAKLILVKDHMWILLNTIPKGKVTDAMKGAYNYIIEELKTVGSTPEERRSIPISTSSFSGVALDDLVGKKSTTERAVDTEQARSGMDRVDDDTEKVTRRTGWERREEYRSMNNAFDMIMSDSVWQDADLRKSLGTNPDRTYSSARLEENKRLFFAILGQETNNFKIDSILGDLFKDDFRNNINNFPFIYNAWKEHHGLDPNRTLSKRNQLDFAIGVLPHDSTSALSPEQYAHKKVLDLTSGTPVNFTSLNQLDTRRSGMQDYEYWGERYSKLGNIADQINVEIRKGGSRKAKLEKALIIVRQLRTVAQRYKSWTKIDAKQKTCDAKFTRSFLMKDKPPVLLMKLALLEFAKMVKRVDQPFDRGSWDSVNPVVRRILISNMYLTGMSGKILHKAGSATPEYSEELNDQIQTMMGQVSSSPAFAKTADERSLSTGAKEVLYLAQIGNAKLIEISHLKIKKEILENIENYNSESNVEEKAKIKARVMRLAPKGIDKPTYFTTMLTNATLRTQELKNTDKIIQLYEKFNSELILCLNNPYEDVGGGETRTKRLIKQISRTTVVGNEYAIKITHVLSGATNKGKVFAVNPKMFAEARKTADSVEINYQTLKQSEKGHLDYFQSLDMRIEGSFENYLSIVRTSPEMHYSRWAILMDGSNPEGFDKMYGLFEKIIPEGGKGKKEFLTMFKYLKPGEVPNSEKQKEKAYAINRMYQIKEYLKAMEERYAASDAQKAEIEARQNGMTIGDRITDYAHDIWDMAFGPGQGFANRAAGMVAIVALYKIAMKAYRGDGKFGKLARVAFIAGALELIVKESTGEGLLERLGVMKPETSIEGMFEAVLVQKGSEDMKAAGIEDREHTAALLELNRQPFHQVVKWYENSREDGAAYNEGDTDYFREMDINVHRIVKGTTWTQENRDLRARKILKLAVKNFFRTIAEKRGSTDATLGKEMVKERYITLIDNPLAKRKFSQIRNKGFIELYHGKQDELTWQTVIYEEGDPQEALDTLGASWMDQLYSKGESAVGYIKNWTRDNLRGKLGYYGTQFFASLGEGGEKLFDFIGNAGERAGEELRFGIDSAKMMYKGHELEIKQFGGQVKSLVYNGVVFPLELGFEGVDFLVQFANTKIVQLRKLILTNESRFPYELSHNGPLTEADIVPTTYFRVVDATTGVMRDTTKLERKAFPQYKYFGRYAKPFYEAAKATTKYYEVPNGAGFFISEIDENGDEAGDLLNLSDPDLINKRLELSYDKAVKFYKRQPNGSSLTDADFTRMLYPIHTKTSKDGKKLFTFWRMPMPGTTEFRMKQAGTWPDYLDANDQKFREPIVIDPNADLTDQLKEIFGLNLDITKTVAGGAGVGIMQILRGVNLIGVGAGAAATAARAGGHTTTATIFQAIEDIFPEPKHKQEMDELLTSAGNKSFAASAFYKNNDHVKWYNALRDFAHDQEQDLYLGPLQTKYPGRTSSDYNTAPTGWDVAKWNAFKTTWETTNGTLP